VNNLFKRIILFPLVLLSISAQPAFGQEPVEDMNYPELMVTPRATKRLQIERKRESKMSGYWYKQHAPLQISALFTLLSSMKLSSDKPFYVATTASDVNAVTENNSKTDDAIKLGQIVGAGWLALTTYMAFNYKPYTTAYNDIRKLPKKTKKQNLTRERIAEEHINKSATIGKRLAWSSFATNLIASAYMASNAKEDATIIAGLSVLASAAPLFISYNWIEVSNAHKEYKKKIYGPIAQAGFVIEPSTKKPIMGLMVNYSF
jgi:hypothetical protein